MTALFKKAARSSQKTLMLVDRHWIDVVATDSVREETDPDTIYRHFLRNRRSAQYGHYKRFLREADPAEVLEKIAILSTLVSKDMKSLILLAE